MAVASTFIHNNLEVMNRNTATKVNPTNLLVNMHITDHGSDWLWAAFSVFLLLTIIHLLLFLYGNFRKPGVKNSLLVIPLFTNAVFLSFTLLTHQTWVTLGKQLSSNMLVLV